MQFDDVIAAYTHTQSRIFIPSAYEHGTAYRIHGHGTLLLLQTTTIFNSLGTIFFIPHGNWINILTFWCFTSFNTKWSILGNILGIDKS